MSPRTHIEDVAFRSTVKPALSFEFMRFSELRARELPHPLVAPTRFQFYLVHYVTRGRAAHSLDFAACPISAGDLVFVAPGRVQQYTPSPSLEMLMVLFTPDFLAQSFDARSGDPVRSARVLSPFLEPGVVRVPKPQRRELTTLLAQMEAEYARPTDAAQPAVLSALLRAFVLQSERLVSTASAERALGGRTEAEAFRASLERSYAHNRSVKRYAHELGVTPRTLNAISERAFGKGAKAFVDERVVLELKRRLAHTDDSVKSLSAQLGFAEPTNLVKFFRHHAGETPLQFRERVR